MTAALRSEVWRDKVARGDCVTYVAHMLNLLSILIGLISLVIVIPAQIPLLGWANWIALPLVVIGVGLGALSSRNGGRNFCLVVFAIAVVRLMLGGGVL
jgi:hypothetical protein